MNEKDIDQFYKGQIIAFEEALATGRKLENRLSYGRLVAFLLAIAGLIILYSLSWPAATAWFIGCITVFGWLVKKQNQVIERREMHRHLLRINQMEQESIQGRFHQYPDGSDFADRNHPFSYDLDLFGRNSLYQMVNRTTSHPAASMLSSWLKIPASPGEINIRQQACADLRERTEWRQNLMAACLRHKDAGNDPSEILRWLDGPYWFKHRRGLRPLCYILTAITLATTAATFFVLPFSVLFMMLVINFIVYYRYLKDIDKLHQLVSRSNDMLNSYAAAIAMIENEDFRSVKLKSLQASFRGKNSASSRIGRLSLLVNKLDKRLNMMVGIFLNLFFFWDIHLCFRLEKWKEQNQMQVRDWFASMAEMEVLSSFANLSFNNPGWAVPEILDGPFRLEAAGVGHPLIPNNKRVCNDFRVDRQGKIILITGSNMSGKSTFLRTIGTNMVLAFSGSVVCASAFSLAPVRLFTCMRISDSLEDNTSTFYAELKRIAMIISEAKQQTDVFLLLDEILHGTNSNDRHAGSVALVRQLVRYRATGMVATHDLGLSKLEDELSGYIENHNFDVKINGEELYFDYLLNKGICKSMNASILMKKMGIDLQDRP